MLTFKADPEHAPRVLAHFEVSGRARTKGSLKAYCTRNRTHTIRIEEQVADSKRWRRRVGVACQKQQGEVWGHLLRHDGPVEVRMVFMLDQDRSKAVGAHFGEVVGSHDTLFPTAKTIGDLDKFDRNVLDALTDSGLWVDDSQVVTILSAKRWCQPGEVERGVILVREAPVPDAWTWPEWMPRVS